MNQAIAIIQARMTSTRLPGKVLKTIKGKPLLEHVIRRIRYSKNLGDTIVATVDSIDSTPVIELCNKLDVKTFAGSEYNVLERYYEASKKYDAQIILRITADCPLVDPDVIDLMIERFLASDCDYLSNTMVRTYPRGLDVEIFTFTALEKAFNEATKDYEKEHVTPYIIKHPDIFKLESFINKDDYSMFRLTVDTIEDFNLIIEIYNRLYKENEIFKLSEIIDLLQSNPELLLINYHVSQKRYTETQKINNNE
jgi:spore coat polysaccharide biosynthesis protein SpsF